MKKIAFLIVLVIYTNICSSQENKSVENALNDELLLNPDLETLLNLIDENARNASPAKVDPRYDFRVQLHPNKKTITEIKIKFEPGSTITFGASRINKNPVVFLSWILNNKLDIEFQKNDSLDTFSWDPGIGNAKTKLARFKTELNKRGIGIEINYDPSLFFCIEANTTIHISLNYEFEQKTLIPEQRKLEFETYVDNEGFISLPIFFESIEPNIERQIINQNFDKAFEAINNSYRLKISKGNGCGRENCINYTEAEKLITELYFDRIKDDKKISKIITTISPKDYFYSVYVYYKGQKFILPYSRKTIDAFFADPLTRKILGAKCKKMKGEIYSRCNILKKSKMNKFNFKINRNYSPSLQSLLPGDIIYIK
jgi:hypothetical protein